VLRISSRKHGVRWLILGHRQFITFALLGGVSTGVDFSVFKALYFLTPLGAPAAQAISYTAGAIVSFLLHQNVTFRSAEHPGILREVGPFAVINLALLGLSVVGIHYLLLTGIATFWAKLLVTALTGLIGYFVMKRMVFRGAK